MKKLCSSKPREKVELEILYRISQTMAHRQNVSVLLNEVLDILEKEMGFIRATLTLRQPDIDVFVIEASRGLSEDEKKRGQYRIGEGITGTVAKTGKSILVPDITKSTEFLNRTGARKQQKVAFICVPIIHHRQVIGTLSIDRETAPESELTMDVNFLNLIAGLLAEAVACIRTELEEKEALILENKKLKLQLGEKYNLPNLIGNCSSMQQVYQQIVQVAPTSATVLIRGETGTGKELVAKAIHYNSDRKYKPLIIINCAALPESLIESELFGHEKGAFTHALYQKKGRFELANGGTIFLDEIGDIPPSVQVKLLRVLQERVFERVGSESSISIDVRIIAATNRNLEQLIKDGSFREDLYYRLNVFPIHLPPLRERKSDIPLLADCFVKKYNKLHNKHVKRISTPAINMMMAYHWPGNVRELENCIERAVVTATDHVIHAYTLPPSLQTAEQTGTQLISSDDNSGLEVMLNDYKRELIIEALKKHHGNITSASKQLKTTPRIINYSIKKLGINPREYK